MRQPNVVFFKYSPTLFRSKFSGIRILRMESIKNIFNYFRGTTTRENENNDLNNKFLNTPNEGRDEPNVGMTSGFNRDDGYTISIRNTFFSDDDPNQDNNIPGFFSDRNDPFIGSGIMNIDGYFQNMMNEMERRIQSMMGFSGFSGFDIGDFQGQNVNFQNTRELTGDSLRDHYLNTGETDVANTNQQIIRMNEPSQMEPFKMSYRMEKITYKVNQDGTAEVTQIIKGDDGREERNVTKFKLK